MKQAGDLESGEQLHEALIEAATTPARRFEMAEAVLTAAAWLERYLARWPMASTQFEEVLEHIRGVVIEKPKSYSGVHGAASAVAWVKTVARNKLFSIFRAERRRRETDRKTLAREAERIARAALAQDVAEREEAALAATRKVLAQIERTCGADPHRLEELRRIRLGVEHRWGVRSTIEQLVDGGYLASGETDPIVRRRAQMLLEQHRRRGRCSLSRWAGRLLIAGRLSTEEVELLCPCNLVPYPRALRHADDRTTAPLVSEAA